MQRSAGNFTVRVEKRSRHSSLACLLDITGKRCSKDHAESGRLRNAGIPSSQNITRDRVAEVDHRELEAHFSELTPVLIAGSNHEERTALGDNPASAKRRPRPPRPRAVLIARIP